MELTYKQAGDYLIPDLEVPENPKVGKFGMLRQTFLREHRSPIYTGMLFSGKLIQRSGSADEIRLGQDKAKDG